MSATLAARAGGEGLAAAAVAWGLTGIAALLLALSCPPAEVAWTAWIAPAPFFLALLLYRGSGRGLLSGGGAPFLLGMLHLIFLVPWFAAFTPVGYPIAGAYWGILSLAVFLPVVRLLDRTPPAAWAPLLACGWVLMEWLRAQGPLALPWGQLASTQHRALAVLQILEFTGSYGLSLLMALTAAGLGCIPAAYVGQFRSGTVRAEALAAGRAGGWWALGATGAAVAGAIWGSAVLAAPSTAPSAVVAVVQSSESHQIAGARVQSFSPPGEYAERTREAVRAGARLVVWPEAVERGDLAHDPVARRNATRPLEGSGAYLLAGAFTDDPVTGQASNSAVLLNESGDPLGVYSKVRIVPFGEYLPLRPLLEWTERLRWELPAADLKAGSRWEPLPWPEGGPVGVSICFESAFPEVSRSYTRRGARLLAVLTSDGWSGRDLAGRQHAMFAPLRAVENRRAVARAAATGISQLIDDRGRVLAAIPMFEKGQIQTPLPLRSDLTLSVRLGDWPVLLAALVLGAAVWRAAARKTPTV